MRKENGPFQDRAQIHHQHLYKSTLCLAPASIVRGNLDRGGGTRKQAARSDLKTKRKKGWAEMIRRKKRKNGVWDSREGGEVKVIQCRDM